MIFNKINIASIIKNHLQTLKNDNSKRVGFDDVFTFFVTPVIISGLLVYFKIKLSDNAINIIITTLSIFVGLLFNVIVLIFDIIKRDATKQVKNKVLKELLANISFTIIISLSAIGFTVLTFIENDNLKWIFTGTNYFLLTTFLITVLMILKRMYKLFTNEIDEIEKANKSI